MTVAERPAVRLSFGLLGPLLIEAGRPVALGGARVKGLLALLLVHANQVVPTDRLIDDLWAGRPTPGAAATLQGYVSDLRKALADAGAGPVPILTRRPGYLLEVEPEQLDVLRFEQLLDLARASLGHDPEAAARSLRQALGLWRGPALADFADEPFARPIVTRLEESRLWALQERVEADLAGGGHAEVVAELGTLTTQHPLRERFWAQRMLALYRCGSQAAALRAYQELRHRLDDELGIEPSPALRRLEAAILNQDPDLEAVSGPSSAGDAAPASRPPEPPPVTHHAAPPTPLTRFIGRSQELAEVKRLLNQTRLLTLTGPGGSGKTRLAMQVALEEAPRRTYGAPFVDLASITDRAEVTGAVGGALGLGNRGDIGVDIVSERLADHQVLLVLDNCEHVVDACAELATVVLSRCPGLVVLATSQEELRVAGETVWRVPTLGLPGPDLLSGDVFASEAVQLFCDRAASALPSLVLDSQGLGDIVTITRRLDGIPLAIELAAALVAVLPLDELVRRLDDRFALLTHGRRGAGPRQRTLRAAVDWSYDLLDERERRLFARLSVFVGQFTLEAAEAVGGAADAFLSSMSSLVSKSIVGTVAGPAGPKRYRLLETLRHYGLEKLEESGGTADARRRHAGYYISFAEAADDRLHSGDATGWSTRMVRELPNLQAALEWLFAHDDIEGGVRLAGALRWWFFGRMGPLWQARTWLQTAVERRHELQPALQLKALTAAMAVAFSQGDFRWTSEIGEEAVALAEVLDDRPELAVALMARGGAAVYEGRTARAVECLDRSLVHCRALGDRWGTAWVLTFRAVAARHSGDDALARSQLEEALSIFRDLRDDHNQVVPLMQLALVAESDDRLDDAGRHAGEALELARRLGDRQLSHGAGCIAGRVELARGRHPEAHRLLVGSLRAAVGVEHQLMVALAVEGLAIVAHEDRQDEVALELWGFAAHLRAASASPLSPERAAQRELYLDEARRLLGAEVVDRSLDRGGTLSFAQVLALVDADGH